MMRFAIVIKGLLCKLFLFILGYLSNGSWNQVVVNNTDGYIKVIVNVDDDPSRNSYRKQSLTEYTQFPFNSGKSLSASSHLLLPTHSNLGRVIGLVGCRLLW